MAVLCHMVDITEVGIIYDIFILTSSNFVKEESRYKSKVGEEETKFFGWSSRIIKDFAMFLHGLHILHGELYHTT